MSIWNNIPVAQLDPVFLSQIERLKDDARRIYTATLQGDDTLLGRSIDVSKQRKWQLPFSWNWDNNLFHIFGPAGIQSAYDRTCPNDLYVRALTKGAPISNGCSSDAPDGEGRVSDCMAEKVQIDYLAIQERAFRLRHATPIRCAIHAAVRRRGHSTANDATGSQAFLQDLGAGIRPGPYQVTGPVGGAFTTMIRYVLSIIVSGYSSGPVDISRGPTAVVRNPDGTVTGVET